jgi:hypothetical protein
MSEYKKEEIQAPDNYNQPYSELGETRVRGLISAILGQSFGRTNG